MPQQPSDGGDDAANDEIIQFRDEGEQEERESSENVPGSDLNEIKSSLVNETESSHSQVRGHRRFTGRSGRGQLSLVALGSRSDVLQGDKRGRDGGYPNGVKDRGKKPSQNGGEPKFDLKIPPYALIPGFPSGFHPNGLPGGKLPLLHAGGPHGPLAQLMFPPTVPSPHIISPGSPIEIDPKTGLPRPRLQGEMPPYLLTPGQLHHPMEVHFPQVQWQGGHPMYPMTSSSLRSAFPPGFASRFHPGMPHHPAAIPISGIPHPAIITSPSKQDIQQQNNDRVQEQKSNGETSVEKKTKQPHVKKPLNAFMLYMKEMRAKVVAECTLKESAAINQILGRRWHALSREEQAKYYELARKERQLHMQLYPGWSARDNYASHGKKKKRKRDKGQDNSEASNPKKCRARYGLDQQEQWCKPCRRKKKCIRFTGGDGSEDADDSSHSPGDHRSLGDLDDQMVSPGPPETVPSQAAVLPSPGGVIPSPGMNAKSSPQPEPPQLIPQDLSTTHRAGSRNS